MLGHVPLCTTALAEEWTGGAIVYLTGIEVGAAPGAMTAAGGAVAALTGIEAGAEPGDIAAAGGAVALLTGIEAGATLGDIVTITVAPAFFDLVTRPDGAMQYLVEITMVPAGDGAFSSGGGMAALGELALVESPPGAEIDTGATTAYLSDRDWVGQPDDPFRGNIWYDGRVTAALIIEKRLPLLPEEPRRAARQYGFVEIANRDGAWDNIVAARSVDSLPVRVLAGPWMARYSDFHPIAEVVGARIEAAETVVRISVRDRARSLDRVLLRDLYEGTGGYEGTAELAGKHRPRAFGYNFNLTPVLLDPFWLVYEVNHGPVQGIVEVFDRAISLPLDTSVGSGGDVASFSELIAAEIEPGHYITCLALGLFRLGSSPTLVTCTVEGDKTGGVYAETIGDVAYRIATGPGGVSSSTVNLGTFNALPAYSCGVYLSPEDAARKTGADVIGEVLGSAGAFWDISTAGFLRVSRHAEPATASPQHWLDVADIIGVRPIENPSLRYRSPVGYARNWTVQAGEDIAEVSDERRLLLAEHQRVAGKEYQNLNIQQRQPSALAPAPYPSLLRYQADAAAVAAHNMALWGKIRRAYEITLHRTGYLMDDGEVISFQWPEHGLSARRQAAIFSHRIHADRDQVIIGVWF